MGSLSSLVPLLGHLTPGAIPTSDDAFLNIPSSAHIFHKYYSYHYSYQYLEKYSFKDKIWIFDGKQDDDIDSVPFLFEDLQYANERKITTPGDYSKDHLYSNFVD